MNRRMYHEASRIDRHLITTLQDIPIFVDENKIGSLHGAESFHERINPESIMMLWIAQRDVSCDSLVVSLFGKISERCCHMLFLVLAI
jgi:hypothetical protein